MLVESPYFKINKKMKRRQLACDSKCKGNTLFKMGKIGGFTNILCGKPLVDSTQGS